MIIGYSINLNTLFYDSIQSLPDWVWWENCIYKIVNLVNNKVYIGQARTFIIRLRGSSSTQWSHLNGYIDHCDSGSHIRLYGAIHKYGPINFEVQIIDEVDSVDELDALEVKYISEYNSTDIAYGYNMSPGGVSGGVNYMASEEVRRVAVPKIVQTNKNNWNGDCMGMCRTETARQKAYETRLKRYGDDPWAPIHSTESYSKSIVNSSKTQLFDNINYRINYIKSLNLDVNPINYYKYPIIGDHHDRNIQSHIDRVLDRLYTDDPISNDDRWTQEIDTIFKWFDSYPDWNSIEQIIYSSDQ